jgi:hypothetical protein
MSLQQDEEESVLEEQDRKGRDGSFQKTVLKNMRLDQLVFWSKDNVVREESMISKDSTSPAGGGSV